MKIIEQTSISIRYTRTSTIQWHSSDLPVLSRVICYIPSREDQILNQFSHRAKSWRSNHSGPYDLHFCQCFIPISSPDSWCHSRNNLRYQSYANDWCSLFIGFVPEKNACIPFFSWGKAMDFPRLFRPGAGVEVPPVKRSPAYEITNMSWKNSSCWSHKRIQQTIANIPICTYIYNII